MSWLSLLNKAQWLGGVHSYRSSSREASRPIALGYGACCLRTTTANSQSAIFIHKDINAFCFRSSRLCMYFVLMNYGQGYLSYRLTT